MFKIAPIQSQEEQSSVANQCGSEYKSGAFSYAMRDAESGELMGFSQFEINADGGILLDLRPAGNLDDYEAMFILGRATMNFIDLCGAHTLSVCMWFRGGTMCAEASHMSWGRMSDLTCILLHYLYSKSLMAGKSQQIQSTLGHWTNQSKVSQYWGTS